MSKLFHAVAHCHANGIIHRDIKPENIMIGKDNEVKLIDFGLSAQCGVKELHLSGLYGTPHYTAPEVLKKDYSYQCDIWSLGVVLYELLSGQMPFEGRSISEVYRNICEGKYDFHHGEF